MIVNKLFINCYGSTYHSTWQYLGSTYSSKGTASSKASIYKGLREVY